ncbi:TRL-like family protein [Catenovulum sediminis]|uniref:TRL domain-containing protein n=1 Tax=Catenovulum sediminis TaxID=1740262 RepID=A0ABV1RD19_9ALTE|nr:TRL-like family protein [Catenovulum sediminis]
MKKLILSAFVALACSGCATSPINGAITVTKWDGNVSNPEVNSVKSGEACANSVLGLAAFGDASIEKAKKNGGVTKVSSVDHSTINILYFYGQYCTIVTGE